MWNQTEFKEKDYDADELDRFPKGAGFPGGKADWGWVQHILASLKPQGRAAVVLDTGAASRGSGNANTNKEKDVRRWFVEQDLIEGVIYLPENLFYNTTAPGIILVLNRAKPKERKEKLFLLNAGRDFTKGDPKNYIAEDAIRRIADTFSVWKEVEKYSRIVSREEIAKNDFNISPSRYIHTGDADEYRPIAEIVEDLDALEEESEVTNNAKGHLKGGRSLKMIEGISIDQIPASWRHVPLGSFCDFSGGTQPPKSTFKDAPSNGYVRLLQIRDFEKDKYAVYVPANKRLRIIESSDISIARYGASVGRILTGKSGAINVAIMTTHPDRSQVEKSFLGFALQHPDFQTYLTGLGGRAAQAGFNKGEVSRFKFPLPPLPSSGRLQRFWGGAAGDGAAGAAVGADHRTEKGPHA